MNKPINQGLIPSDLFICQSPPANAFLYSDAGALFLKPVREDNAGSMSVAAIGTDNHSADGCFTAHKSTTS